MIHSSLGEGHSNFFRTYKQILGLSFLGWKKNDICKYVAFCETRQHNKYDTLKLAGLLQPLSILTQVWEDIVIDFISGSPNLGEYDTIMVMVDHFTKFSHFLPQTPKHCKTRGRLFCS